MEGNRDEAERCVRIAREALGAGDRGKAQRFLQKAERLYPLPAARGEHPTRPDPSRARPAVTAGRDRRELGVSRLPLEGGGVGAEQRRWLVT